MPGGSGSAPDDVVPLVQAGEQDATQVGGPVSLVYRARDAHAYMEENKNFGKIVLTM